jgi:hypothetical protein
MKPPKCKAMDEYAALIVKMGELEGAMVAAKEQLRTIPQRMARELITPQDRLEAARYLYWYTDVNCDNIAEHLLGTDINGWHVDTFLERIGAHTSDIICAECSRALVFQSRQQMRDTLRQLRRSRGIDDALCPDCAAAENEKRQSTRT